MEKYEAFFELIVGWWSYRWIQVTPQSTDLAAKNSSRVRKMMKDKSTEKKIEERKNTDKYSSMEFISNDFIPVHMFPVYNIPPTGIGIIVREDSAALKHLKVGRIMDAKFKLSKLGGIESCKVEISHITMDDKDRLKGHYSIGLSILES